MDKTVEERQNHNAELQLNSMEYNFKQDCRRTAMQLASRNSTGQDASKTVEQAQVLYDWMIDIPRPQLI